MKTALKLLFITGLITVSGIIGISVSAQLKVREVTKADVRLCRTTEKCRVLSGVQYTTLKTELVRKVETKEVFQVDEWKDLVAIMDREIKAEGKMVLNNVTSKEELQEKIIQFLKR